MAKFSSLFPWLRTLYPPAEARGFQPSEISEDVSLVHQVHQGTDFLDKALNLNAIGTLGAVNADGPDVESGFYWYVIACGAFHDDTTDRELEVTIRGAAATWPLASGTRIMPADVFVVVPRAFILPTFQRLRGAVPSITAGKRVVLRALYFKIALGLPPVPSP